MTLCGVPGRLLDALMPRRGFGRFDAVTAFAWQARQLVTLCKDYGFDAAALDALTPRLLCVAGKGFGDSL